MKVNLIDTLPKKLKPIAKFISIQESEADISTSRIGQELATNLLPKSIFARGLVDLCDNAFREVIETFLIYIGPKILGEHVFRKLYCKVGSKGLNDLVPTTAAELIKTNNPENKKLMPLKAAIAVSAFAIPLAEYSLSYVKNLFTLKMFKQADFNNIANLNKNKKETLEHQEKVKESAKKHIKLAGGLFAGCLGLSALLLTHGKNSRVLNHLSEAILAPGSKFFKKSESQEFFNKYFGLDFANKNGKLAMSNGQITACVVVGGFGYFGAAKDRGKQDFKEILYRFPLVGFYAISGCALVDKGFKAILRKKGGYENLLGKDNNFKTPKLNELSKLAETLASKNGTTAEAEFKKLFKQKSMIVLAPFLFSIGFMGLFVAGCSRFFTQYRYNKDAKMQGHKA